MMKTKQQLLKQISFRLYDTDRDKKIYEYLENITANQSEILKELIAKQITDSETSKKTSKNVINEAKKDNQGIYTQTAQKLNKRFSGGFKGFQA